MKNFFRKRKATNKEKDMEVLSNWQKGMVELRKVRGCMQKKEFDLAAFHTNAAEGFFRRAIAAGEKCEGITL